MFHGTVPGGPSSWNGSRARGPERAARGGARRGAREAGERRALRNVTLSRDASGGDVGADVRIIDAAVATCALGEGHLTVETTGGLAKATLGFAGPAETST